MEKISMNSFRNILDMGTIATFRKDIIRPNIVNSLNLSGQLEERWDKKAQKCAIGLEQVLFIIFF